MFIDKFNKLITHKRFLPTALAIIFLVSIIYSFYYQIVPAVDARAYDNIALNILAGNGFKEQGSSVPILFDMSIQRAGPAYEYLLAGIYIIFGHHYSAVWIIQALLHTLTAYLIYKICLKIFNSACPGALALLIFGLHPDLIENSAMLLTETWYLFTVTLVVYLFVLIYENSQSWWLSFLLGVSLVVSIYSRPTVILFVPIIYLLYLIRKNYLPIALSLVTIIVLMTPWTLRNYKIYHQFIPTTLIGQYNIWIGNTLVANGGQLSGGFNPWDDYAAKNGFADIKNKASQEFKNFLFQHPLTFIKLSLVRTVRYFSLIRPMGFWFYQVGLGQMIFVGFSALFIALLFVTGWSGILIALSQKKSLYYYLIALAITAPLPLIATVVESRYRFQIYPFLAMFGGYALYYWFTNKGWYKQLQFLIPTVFLLLISLVDVLMSSGVIIERLKTFL